MHTVGTLAWVGVWALVLLAFGAGWVTRGRA